MPFAANAFVTFSDPTFALERAMAFWPNGINNGHGGILSFALVDGGNSAVLLVRLQQGLLLDGQEYSLGSGYDALALIKVKLAPRWVEAQLVAHEGATSPQWAESL